MPSASMWRNVEASNKLGDLRDALPTLLDEADAKTRARHLEALERIEHDALPPSIYRSPEALWLSHAERELDDDEIALFAPLSVTVLLCVLALVFGRLNLVGRRRARQLPAWWRCLR